jgi:hypothetical protein
MRMRPTPNEPPLATHRDRRLQRSNRLLLVLA